MIAVVPNVQVWPCQPGGGGGLLGSPPARSGKHGTRQGRRRRGMQETGLRAACTSSPMPAAHACQPSLSASMHTRALGRAATRLTARPCPPPQTRPSALCHPSVSQCFFFR